MTDAGRATGAAPPPGAAPEPPVPGHDRAADPSRTVRVGQRMPAWLGSIRVRIALLYSSILVTLAAVVLVAVYLGLAHQLSNQTVSREVTVLGVDPQGRPFTFSAEQVDQYAYIEREANTRALDSLRSTSLVALGGLFVASLGISWIVSGRVLRPIERITGVARDIQATDLSRRIALRGPDDELKQLADTFDDMLGRIDGAFESQRQFIHEASHELRNPLAVIRTNLDVTLADPDAGVDELRRTAEVVQRSTDRMARLVDDLLVYARKGSLSLERSRVDVSDVVAEAAEEFAVPATEQGIRLEHVAPSDLWVEGDRLALRQALANLIVNALRLSPTGSLVRLTAGREGPWVWMAVQDQGPGIAPEDQDRVFQRFWRGDPREGRDAGRSGLGLTIVRQVAEAHGGLVKLVSEPGEGSAFALWLPAEAAPPPAAPGAPPAAVG